MIELPQDLDIGLRLARETGDHVAADARLGGRGPDAPDQRQEGLRLAEAAHGAQHVTRGVLEAEIEVGDDLVRAEHGVDQPWPDLGRLQVRHADPLEAVDAGEPLQQPLKAVLRAEVLAVGGGVL